MPIDLDTLRRAHDLARDAVEAVVNESFPTVARMAYALTGRNAAGNRVVRHIVRRGLKMMPTWHDEGEPQRWFLHHTILACRREGPPPPPSAAADLLLTQGPQPPSAADVAFVRALRALPQQQVEAFLLHFGESFNPRYMAVAMDCSTAAAQQHLESATTALRTLAGGDFEPQTARLRRVYQSLTPADRVRLPQVGALVRRHVWPRRAWRVMKLAFGLAVLLGLGWAAWKVVPNLEF